MNSTMGAALASVLACTAASAQETRLDITFPTSGATVAIHETVRGRVSDPAARVWLIIHPTATLDCWVQPMAEVENGQWFADATFGLPQSRGAEFTIRALVNPTGPLVAGQRLACWPEAQIQSATVRGLVRN